MKTVKKLINLSVISTGFYLLTTSPLWAVTIGYFNNSNFSFEGESEKLLEVLENGGHNLTQFDSLEASVWQEIAEQNQAIVIPDLSRNSLFPSLPSDTQMVLRNYVDNGGGFLMVGEVREVIPLFNGVFGFETAEDFWGDGTILNTEDAQGTIFESAPSSLPDPFLTTTMAINSLPSGSLDLYNNVPNSSQDDQNSSSVFVSPFSSGKVAFNAFGYQDINNALGWSDVTNLTVEFIAKDSIPEESVPEPSVTFGLIVLGGLGVLSSCIQKL